MSQESAESGLMTFRQAAAWLGMGKSRYAARKLERRVLSKERKLGASLVVRMSSAEKETRSVTGSMLRQHFPEFFPSKVKQLRRDMEQRLAAIDEHVRAASQAFVAQQVEPRLAELWERDEQIAESLNELAERVELLAGPRRPV